MKYRVSLHVLVIAGLAILLAACSDNPAIRLRYKAEKMLFEAERLATETTRPKTELLSQVYPPFHDCIEFCYRALDSVDAAAYPVEHNELKYLAYKSSLRLSELFFSIRQFDSSAAILNRLMDTVLLSDKQLLQTCISLGQALQSSGQWDSALIVYNFTIEEFYPPVDNLGELVVPAFILPERIYRIMSIVGNSVEIATSFTRAEEYYRRVINEHPDTKLETAARLALADLYDDTHRWQQELDELRYLADSSLPGHRDIVMRMADVYGGGLKQYDTALTMYDYLLAHLMEDDTTSMGPDILFKISMVRMEQKKYDEARRVISQLKQEYPKYYDTIPMPQYNLARSLELDGEWERAEVEYRLLIEKYKGSDEAMMALIYMIDYLRLKGRLSEAKVWQQRAEEYYDELAIRSRGELTEARAMFYKAELHRRLNNHDSAAQILLDVFARFPDTEPGQRAIQAAVKLYRNELRDPATADSLLNLMKKHAPSIPDGG